MNNVEAFLSIKEAAKLAKVTTDTIRYHMFKSRKLSARKVETNDKWMPAWYVSRVSLENLYYNVISGEKQHTTKVLPISETPNIFNRLNQNPELYNTLVSNEHIEAAICLLKAKGYKVFKPVITHEEV